MSNYTILLIDYEPRSIERFRDPLVAAGYRIEIATDGIFPASIFIAVPSIAAAREHNGPLPLRR